MKRYHSHGNNSGVIAYEAGDDNIRIQFRDGETYLYTYQSAGKSNIEQMKKLAIAGRGLATFINRKVKNNYSRKLTAIRL